MDLLQAAVLGTVQGLSEFLPISSSGHLIMVPFLQGWPPHSQAFDLALHVGTLVALLWFFWADWLSLIRGFFRGLFSASVRAKDPAWRMALLVLLGSIPAGLIGIVAEKPVETLLRSPALNAGLLIVFGLVLYVADRMGSRKRAMDDLGWPDALTMGLAQALALMPGVSRSGITMTAGLLRGLDRPTAARFSFLLSGPIIGAAALFKLREGIPSAELAGAAVGAVTSAIVGFVAIGVLLRYLQRNSLTAFVIYRVLFGLLVIGVSAARGSFV
ncbi:MAG TPA: undecaprenyl-diphosphate phosphatase [Chloroflexota bacterium]